MARDRDATRERLLEIGREHLVDQGLRPTLDIRLTDVLEEAGMTTGAAYNIWATQDEYLHDLALHVARSLEWADDRLIAEVLDKLAPDATPEQWIDVTAETYFRLFTARRDYFLLLHFWGVADPSPELVTAIQEGYDVVHQSFVGIFSTVLDHYDLEVRPPTTLDDLAVMITATCEGTALRARFQPDSVNLSQRHAYVELAHTIYNVHIRQRAQ